MPLMRRVNVRIYRGKIRQEIEQISRCYGKTILARSFIIGGGISKESEKYLPLLTIDTPVIPAQFLNEAGIVGAALAVRKNEIEPSD